MSDRYWEVRGREFHLRGGSRHAVLRLDEDHPGVSWPEAAGHGKFLALQSVSTVGRCDEAAFAGPSLTGVAHHRNRVEASFAPSGWGGLRIRATWAPTPVGDGLDLEVQIQASTAELLAQVEVGVLSEWGEDISEPVAIRVEPRDARSAARSYDGRESARILESLTTLPIPSLASRRLAPRIFASPNVGQHHCYAEMVQPNDCARRIVRGPEGGPAEPGVFHSTRYALFGHDLEKGVVLRARLRGLWMPSLSPEGAAQACYDAFLNEPPSLGP